MGGYSVRVCVAKDARERLVSVARTVGRRAVTSRLMVWIAVPPRAHLGPVAPAQKPTAPALCLSFAASTVGPSIPASNVRTGLLIAGLNVRTD